MNSVNKGRRGQMVVNLVVVSKLRGLILIIDTEPVQPDASYDLDAASGFSGSC